MSIYLSIIIPAYNEEKRIGGTLTAISSFLAKKDFPSEIIVIDDGSTDATAAAVANFQFSIFNFQFLHHEKNLGKGAALKTGILASQGDFVLFADADGSTPIEELDKLLPYLSKKDFDIAIGSRYIKGANIQIKQPWYRRILGRLGNLIIQLFLLPGITDTQCGFKLFKGDIARKLFSKLTIKRFGFDMEILYLAKRKGLKIVETPVTWLDSPRTRLRPIRDAAKTLSELMRIKYNSLTGKY
ncbi:MAG: glycosyltransferase family 2 protein [Candidatus Cloacimonetes bacterium]|nr:glycosyltransferase family 2 protein [Candidatus Cloacimonadota bacterium]